MRAWHSSLSTKPAATSASGIIGSQQWNDIQPVGYVTSNYSASGTVPTTVDLIRAIGGSGGIALLLTPKLSSISGASGTFYVGQVYKAIKADAAAGAVNFADLNGALIGGASSYSLTQQGQWAEFSWNGTSWDAFGGQAA
jgi:hypothetical protein